MRKTPGDRPFPYSDEVQEGDSYTRVGKNVHVEQVNVYHKGWVNLALAGVISHVDVDTTYNGVGGWVSLHEEELDELIVVLQYYQQQIADKKKDN